MKLNCGLVRYPISFTMNFVLVHIFATWNSHFPGFTVPAAQLLNSIKPDVYDGVNLQIGRGNKVEAFSASKTLYIKF